LIAKSCSAPPSTTASITTSSTAKPPQAP
jgi:hypothetical protein